MNLRTTLILLAVLLVCGGAWWLLRGQPDSLVTPQKGVDDEATPVFEPGTLSAERVERIEITQQGRETVLLEQRRGRWRMTEPVRFAADGKTVHQLVQTLAALADQGDAEQDTAGTAIAELTFTINGEPRAVTFGPRLGGGLASLRIDGGPPRLVNDTLHGFFERYRPTDLLSKQLATPPAHATHAFTLTTAEGTVRLEQRDGQWYFDGHRHDPALSEPVPGAIDVEGYLNIPSATKIERFAPTQDANPAAYGLDAPRVRIDYQTPDANGDLQRSTLLIGAPADAERAGYYASYYQQGEDRPVVFVLPAAFSVVMAKSADDFRDPRPFAVAAQNIARIEADVPGSDAHWAVDLVDERGSVIDPRRSATGDAADLRRAVHALLNARPALYATPDSITRNWREAYPVTLHQTLGRRPVSAMVYSMRGVIEPESDDEEPYVLVVREDEYVGLLIPERVFTDLREIARR